MVAAAARRDSKAQYGAVYMDVQRLVEARSPQLVELCDVAIAH